MANEAFRKAHKNLAKFETRSSFRTWLTRIANNAAIDRMRQRKRIESREIQVENRSGEENPDGPATSVESFPDQSGSDPMTALLEKGRNQQIERALAGLSDVLQQTYRLRYESDLSYKEIAAAMDCKIGTVMSRINTLKQKLGEYIQEEDRQDESLAA